MPAQPWVRRVHEGSAATAPEWECIEAIFVACFGSDALDLAGSGGQGLSAGWVDGQGRHFSAEQFQEVGAAYLEGSAETLHFHGERPTARYADFEYAPAAPHPRARLAVRGVDEKVVAKAIAAAQSAFPLPPEGGQIFLSWGGATSWEVANVVSKILRSRFPQLEVFLSSSSIDPGDDPTRRILDEGLLKCQVLVAALTPEAVSRPWVIWEIAAAWGREQLVIPVFVGADPNEVPGPLAARVQGVHLGRPGELDRALEVIAQRFRLSEPDPLSVAEHAELNSAAVGTPS